MAKQRQISLSWPVKGLDKRGSYEKQAPYSTPDALNVWTDDRSEGRERGGSRPGLGKAFNTQIGGGNPIRFLETLYYVTGGARASKLVASSNGQLWHETGTSTMAQISTDVSLSNSLLTATGLLNRLYIADHGTEVAAGSDGVIASDGVSFTSSSVGDFAADGVDADDHAVVIRTRGVGVNDVQRISLDGTPTGGTFYLTYGGSRTVDLAHNASATTIKNALVTLSSIGKDSSGNENVACAHSTGNSANTLLNGTITVTFQNDLAYSQRSLIVPSSGNLTGGGTNEVQTITLAGTPTGGTFTLSLTVDGVTDTTVPIAYNAVASAVETAIEGMANVPSGEASCAGGALPGAAVTVTFSGSLGSRNLSLLLSDSRLLTGGTNSYASVAETTVGVNTVVKVSRSVVGKPANTVTGSFQIEEVDGTTITLKTSPNPEGTTSIKFRIARTIKVYNPDSGTVTSLFQDWLRGSAPVNCTTIAAWRNRLVAVESADPQNFKMSRQNNPFDWDYTRDDAQRAVAATLSTSGSVGEPITALIPYHHNCLVIGCDSSIWVLTGDLAAGGSARRLDDEIGVLDKSSWCFTAGGYLFFMSRDGLYLMPPGCGVAPTSVSRELMPEELINIDVALVTVTMAYDLRFRGIHLFLYDGSNTSHWFIDVKTRMEGDRISASFWPVAYQAAHGASSCHSRKSFTGNVSNVVFGGKDGYIRALNSSLDEDDGSNAISSYIIFGPFALGDSAGATEGKLNSICASLGRGSGDVTWSVHVGQTAEDAISAAARESGTWTGYSDAGLQYRAHPKARGCYAAIKVTSEGT